ncbi:MAG: hypothetical protein BMS9Abin10_0353 [Gammaproteobacteria bacterium]|nr:MAG: hypothetical protein BMS9Abin10_0353 [Gammaproteobacteria bacterium]
MITISRLTWLCCLLVLLLPATGWTQTITIPTGTVVYGELEQQVSSKKKQQPRVGDIIKARVWRDVVVEGRTVIKAGAPMVVRVANVKQAKFAGIKGKLQLEAVSLKAADGTEVMLDGGYNKAGKGRMALSISLAAVVWPTIFIKGKQVILEPGTLFDAEVQNAVTIAESAAATSTRRQARMGLLAEVVYNRIDPKEKKLKSLPLRVRRCGGLLDSASVASVNGVDIAPIDVELEAPIVQANCATADGKIGFKPLAKQFRPGINRFEVEASGARSEVILDMEM